MKLVITPNLVSVTRQMIFSSILINFKVLIKLINCMKIVTYSQCLLYHKISLRWEKCIFFDISVIQGVNDIADEVSEVEKFSMGLNQD